ncbi:MAG: hypothetical protein ACRDH2_14045, partial [Anaerolineales bacterium]
APPLIAILAMAALGLWVDVARVFLFGHHLFWMFAIILLIHPVTETLSPSPTQKKKARQPQPSAKDRQRAGTGKHTAKHKPATISETLAERLARLRKQKEAVDQKIEKLAAKDKERVK